MKTCKKCGNANPDEAKFCNICGNSFEYVPPNQQQTSSYDFNPNQQGNNNTDLTIENQQQYTPQDSYKVHNTKIKYLAPILDLIGGIILYFLCGIGQLYLGLYKRGIVLCLLGFIPLLIGSILILTVSNFAGSFISLIIGVILTIYSAYDAHVCTNAINEGRSIPLLFGSFNLE